nr:hypothetical protein Iba_scaffold11956CG0010 [Ipomoea batatas]
MLSSHTVSRHAMAIDGNISRSAEQRSGAIGEQQWSIQRRVNGKAWAAMTSCSCDGLHQRSPFPLFPATLSRWATIAAMAAPGEDQRLLRSLSSSRNFHKWKPSLPAAENLVISHPMLSNHTVSRHAMAIDGNISRSAEQRSGAIGEQQWSIQRHVNGKAWAAMTSCSCDGLHQRSPFPLFPATLSRWATIAAMAAPGEDQRLLRSLSSSRFWGI